MSESITITGSLPAWLFTACYKVEDLTAMVGRDAARALEMLAFRRKDYSDEPGRYTQIGQAQITVTLHSSDQLVASQIASLQAALAAERAGSVQRQNAILERISKLSALTFDGEAREQANPHPVGA